MKSILKITLLICLAVILSGCLSTIVTAGLEGVHLIKDAIV